MAKWRAIHADISTSGQVNNLTEFEKLLFTWMIPHADDWGILTGDPVELKLKVMPGTDRQSQEIADALRHIQEVGLIWQYQPDGEGPLVQFCKWDDHQPIRKDRRQPCEHTLYTDACQLPTSAGHCPAEPGKDGLYQTRQDIDKRREDGAASRDPRLDHEAIIGYKGIAHLHVPTALRDDWIACAEEVGTEKLLAFTKEWIGNGWNKQNVNGIMEYARKGGGGGKRAKSSRRDLSPERIAQRAEFDRVAEERQRERDGQYADA